MLATLHHPFSRWIPWVYVLVFIPVIAVNVLLVRLALTSNTGLVTDHAFDTGQSYNAVIEAGARQQALGWQVTVDAQPAPQADAPHRVALSIALTDSAGKPLTGLTVSGRVVSPVDPQPDAAATLVETAGGHYRETIALPRAGQWELQLVATNGTDRFAIVQRVTAP
jgi:nitrogen fixation protein FixH